MPTIYDFRNRIAVVNGGATVWLWDRDIALARAAAAELGAIGEALAVAADVSDLAEVEAAARAVHGGRIDILVNNAGISGPNAPTWEYPPPDWAQVLAVNLTGTFNCCKAV